MLASKTTCGKYFGQSGKKREPVDYVPLTRRQAELVKKLAAEQRAAPNEQGRERLVVEVEKLTFYQNAVGGNLKERARRAAERARTAVLSRAVTQPLPKPE
jgi:hypothetical protein